MHDLKPNYTPMLVMIMLISVFAVLVISINQRNEELKKTRSSLNSCMVNLTHCLSSGSLLDKVSGRAYFCDVAKIDGL